MKITFDTQYQTALINIEAFIKKGFSNLTEKENKELKQTSSAVEAYEKVKYPMPVNLYSGAITPRCPRNVVQI
ncbi:MAG TPA: hypothetical protein VK625_23595 [Flavitalea sp.]|nr:hypothetical protein [Flavitalea sp.]